MYHFRKPTDDDENRIVTGALPTMSRYWEQLQVSIVFLGNKSFSFPMSKWPTRQLSSNDLRNVGQALIVLPTSSQPSNISALILGLDVFFQSASPELK